MDKKEKIDQNWKVHKKGCGSMQFNDFKLERYFAKYEFHVKYLLSPSDCESLTIPELLEYADEDGKKCGRI